MWDRMCRSTFKPVWMSTPGGSDGKESACNVGDWDLIPGSGRSPGGGNGNPVQYSCLENPTDRGAWRTTVYRVTKSRTRLSDLRCLTCSQILTNKLCDLVSKSTCLSLSFHIYKTRLLWEVDQSILKEISPGCSLEGLMLKLKLQYFGPLVRRADSLEKTLMLGKTEGGRRRGR